MHEIDGDADIVRSLVKQGMSDADICQHLGIDAEPDGAVVTARDWLFPSFSAPATSKSANVAGSADASRVQETSSAASSEARARRRSSRRSATSAAMLNRSSVT